MKVIINTKLYMKKLKLKKNEKITCIYDNLLEAKNITTIGLFKSAFVSWI